MTVHPLTVGVLFYILAIVFMVVAAVPWSPPDPRPRWYVPINLWYLGWACFVVAFAFGGNVVR